MNDRLTRKGPLGRFWQLGAWAWVLCLVLLAYGQWRIWSAESPVDTDILALLPQSAEDRLLSDVTRHIADANARQVVVVVGSTDPASTRLASETFQSVLAEDPDAGLLQPQSVGDGWFEQAAAFYAPYRDRLLTDAQRTQLHDADPEALGNQAVAALFGPMGGVRLTAWQADPLGLWPAWWQQRAASSGLALSAEGLLERDGQFWTVLQYQTPESAFKLDGENHIAGLIDRAEAAARKAAGELDVLRAGVPLHAEAAAVQADSEINTIGWGSLAAVLLLVWLAFGSMRPIVMVAASLLIGCGVALAVTVLVFGKIHVLTLVFGASLVGVAEDYGIHWFASRQASPAQSRSSLLRELLPGLWLALLTSAMAYLALALAPFPGLRQMALFSVVGLTAAFLTVILWFPWLDRGQLRATRFSQWLGGTLDRLPRLRSRRQVVFFCLAIVLFAGVGISRLTADDDLRSLQSSPPALIADQVRISQLLALPSPAQFYLVQGETADAVLEREQALVARLASLVLDDRIGGYRAVSDWVPSQSVQDAAAELTSSIETQVLHQVSGMIGETLERPAFSTGPLKIEDVMDSPAAQPFASLWAGRIDGQYTSVVMVDDGGRTGALAQMEQAASGLPGVRWVNRTADFSDLLAHYRQLMSGLLLVGVLLVLAVLALRYRRHCWRVFVPTALSVVLTLGLLGWLGQPLQLFNVLALMLLMGMGIDYGIFLVEHKGDRSAWLAVCVGAASTWLSFGLLGLSATPALASFGMTLLFGIALVWMISPLFRPLPETEGATVTSVPPALQEQS